MPKRDYKCLRCGKTFQSYSADPERCKLCGSYRWDEPNPEYRLVMRDTEGKGGPYRRL